MTEVRIQQFETQFPLSPSALDAMRLSAQSIFAMDLDMPDQLNAYAEDLSEYNNFLAQSGNLVVATGSVMLDHANDRAYLDNVAVAGTHRRGGLGAQMTAHLENFAREAGMPKARLYPCTDKAMKLCEKLGYSMILDPDSGQLEGMEKRLN